MRIRQNTYIMICTAGVVLLGAVVLSNRPWRSAKHVENSIRQQTPPGSSRADVREFIRKQDWGICLDSTGNTSSARDDHYTGVIGFYTLGASLPDYGFPFRIHTEAYWGFDVNEKLIDMHVRSWSEGM
jgi:hypothetical protein